MAKIAKNEMQTLTATQQSRGFFAVVATGAQMMDGESQNMKQCFVRLRDGTIVNVATLPQIDPDNPQPNGDYSISLNANHSDDVRDKGGEGWLDIKNGVLHMYGVLVANTTGNEILPLVKNGMCKFSTEGFAENYDDGFLIYAVAPVLEGNDPGTQIAKNSKKGTTMAEKISKEIIKSAALAKLNAESEKNDDVNDAPARITSALSDLGVDASSPMYVDIFTDLLTALTGGTTDPEPDTADDGNDSDPTTGMSEAESTAANNSAKGVKSIVINQYSLPKAVQTNGAVEGEFVEGDAKLNRMLKSKAYIRQFGEAMIKANGSPEKFNEELASIFKKNDLTFNPDEVQVVPEVVVTQVVELLQSDGSLIARLRNTGAAFWQTFATVEETTYAQGRPRNVKTEKTEQTLEIQPRSIIAGQIYKFIRIPDALVQINSNMAGNAIINYVSQELPVKVVRAMEEAVLVGGVVNDDSTPFTSAISIMADALDSTSNFATVVTPDAGTPLGLAVQQAASQVLPTNLGFGNLVLVTSRQKLQQIKASLTAASGDFPVNLTATDQQIADYLGVDSIVTPAWLQVVSTDPNRNANIATFLSTYVGAVFDGNSYAKLGNDSPTSMNDYFIPTNTHDFEAKVMFGGALTSPHSAVLVANVPGGTTTTTTTTA